MSFLGDDWILQSDGLRHRNAARVLVLDQNNNLLLARGHDLDNPRRHWWFTVGGGIDAGETAKEAAVRELREETGIRASTEELVGPVLSRSAEFDFAAELVKQHEIFYLLRLSHRPELSTLGWTQVEKDMIEDLQWWSLFDLHQTEDQVYPEGLANIVSSLAESWNGVLLQLGDVRDLK